MTKCPYQKRQKKRTADDPDFLCNIRKKASNRQHNESSDDTENDTPDNSQSSSNASSQRAEPTAPRATIAIKIETACDRSEINQNINQEALSEYDASKLNKINNRQTVVAPGSRSAHKDVLERLVKRVGNPKLNEKLTNINKTDTKLYASEIFETIIQKERERVEKILLESNMDKALVDTVMRKIRSSSERK